jgi:hypothetical protein
MTGRSGIALTAALLLGLQGAVAGPSGEANHADAASTALRYLTKYFCKTADETCCLTFRAQPPPVTLVERLRDLPQFRALLPNGGLARDVCGVLDVDVSEVVATSDARVQVTVTFGSKGSRAVCEVAVSRVGGRWTPDAEQKGCVHFQ